MDIAQPRTQILGIWWLQLTTFSARLAWAGLDKRAVAITTFTATAITAFLLARYYYPWAPIGLAALSGAWVLSPKRTGPKVLFLALVSIPGTWIIAALGAELWGFGLLDATVTLALWWGVMLALYTVAQQTSLLAFLIPTWLLQAAVTIRDGVEGIVRTSGLTDSPNVSGGFLVLGIIYLLTTRFRWLALPLMVALPFTGSRWASLVLVLVVVGIVSKRIVPLRFMATIVAAAILLTAPFFGTISPGYRLPALPQEEYITTLMQNLKTDVRYRLTWSPAEAVVKEPGFQWSTPASLLGVAPMGFMGANGIHSVPERMAYELGFVPLAIWGLVGLWALCIKPRWTATWWMLLAFLGLCSLDYYAWMPFTISAFWWTLLALRVKERA